MEVTIGDFFLKIFSVFLWLRYGCISTLRDILPEPMIDELMFVAFSFDSTTNFVFFFIVISLHCQSDIEKFAVAGIKCAVCFVSEYD